MVDTQPVCVHEFKHLEDGDPKKVCNRRQGHPIHTPRGLSPYEHRYVAPVTAEDKTKTMVTVVLSKKTIKKAARESGKSLRDLERMRQMGKLRGRPYTIRYELKG